MQIENLKKNDKIWLSGRGNTEAKIMIIVSHPTHGDLKEECILAEDDEEYGAIDEIRAALKTVNIDEDDCWFTSIVKFGLGSKDKPNAKQIEECAEALDEELNEIKPNLIITLGAEAFKRIMKTNISQADYLGEIVDSPYGKVMANYSPANVFRVDPKLRPEFIENFLLAKRFIDGKLKYQNFEHIIVTDPEVNKEILQHYIDNKMFDIGYDAEWKGKFMKGEVMYTFQYSCEPHKAIILPLLDANKKPVDPALLNSMKLMLEHPKARRMGWNIRADDKRLTLKGFKLPDETLAFDGMKAVALFDSRYRKGLEVGIKKFTDYRPYYNKLNKALREHKLKKEEMSDLMFLEPDTFFEYCAGDAVAHRTACLKMMEDMPAYVPKKVRDYYYEVYLPLSHYLMDMELTGLSIDIPCMTKLTEQYKECYELLSKRLFDLTKKYGFDTAIYEASVEKIGKEETEKLGLRPDFNPRSYLHKAYFFFEKLKLTPAYYNKKGKPKPKSWYDRQKPVIQRQCNPSSNGKSMASIRFQLEAETKKNPNDKTLTDKYDVVKTYLDLARISVFSNKFLSTQGVDFDEELGDLFGEEGDDEDPLKSSYWAALADDNKIHADFYECLDNYRSSSKVNVQNPASKVLSHIPGIFEGLGLEVPKNIRNIFCAGHKDWHFAEVDVAGADLAIAAFLSRDPEYIKDILNGGFHTTKMREYFKDPKLSKNDASKYVTAKSITFRVAYTAGLMSAAEPIQAEIFAESGHYVDIEVIKYALQTWLRYETYMEYRDACQKQVDNTYSIENLRGMKFNFEFTKDFGIKAGWYNQSLAYPIASELALFIWEISVRMKEKLKKDGNWMKWCCPVSTVHDANYWVIHKDMMKDNYFPELCKQYFTDEVRIVTGDALGMEMVISDCWKGKNKVFSNETSWDFKEKCWKWK